MESNEIRVLIIEDDKEDYLLAKHYLLEIETTSFSIDWVSTYEEALLRVADKEHDVYLVDHNLGNENGIELVKQATNSGILKPFIFLTGMDDLAVDKKALDVGAVDFLIKQKINKDSLDRSIRYAIQQKRIERELMESNNTKNKLFSIISHDLRSPLTTLQSTLEMLTDPEIEVGEEMGRKLLHGLSKSTKNTLNLLDNLLNWSRSQIGALTFDFEQLNLNNSVQQVFSVLEGSRKQKRIELINKVPEDLKIYTDQNLLNLIIRNLLSNAIKFTPELGEICVEAYEDDAYTVFSVTDTGVGISEIGINRILQADTSYTTYGTNDEKGSGLGLVIVQEFIAKQKGKFDIKSVEGRGSSFIVSFPRADEAS